MPWRPLFYVLKVQMHSFFRHFKLYLTSSTERFSQNFKVVVVDGKDESEYPVKWQDFFSGHVVGEPDSRVLAHIGDDDITIRINTDGTEYNIEPLWRLINDTKDKRVLVYKSEDIKNVSRLQSPKVCGYIKADNEELLPKGLVGREPPDELVHRVKRRADPNPLKNTCKLLVVADHRFYRYMGRGEESTTTNYLIELIDRVDDIYRNTSWDNAGFKGYGIQIEQIRILKSPQEVRPGQRHFNMAKSYPSEEKDAWDVKMLLEQFSFDIAEEASKVCLAHLFTYQDFDMGTLGLAYVGSPRANSHGGVCPKAYYSPIGKKNIYLNSGLTSTKNYGKTILTKEADLVTTHELGHNFGAEHDPDGLAECAPNEDQGGKYVMYPIAVSGDHENNKMFSNCSKQSIYKTIESKAQECFQERSNKVCGNSRVDEGEECDPGIMYLNNDTCCNSDCTLRPGVQCSDRNSPCCKNCQFETAQKKCQEAINATCKGVSYCTGMSSRWFSWNNLLKRGKCEKRVQDVIERFWEFIDKLSINTFGEMKTLNQVSSGPCTWLKQTVGACVRKRFTPSVNVAKDRVPPKGSRRCGTQRGGAAGTEREAGLELRSLCRAPLPTRPPAFSRGPARWKVYVSKQGTDMLKTAQSSGGVFIGTADDILTT
ncbi:hypothetical protein E2I00_006527 [Balaenoptera physalus]|uniref:Uncharacterized protein n=1 Tax=Balaenoptera physalus TaxID=9770 RepID=A0A643CE84_BALPH|nr:hypothetical protein E2I00_006527 [Balaenoptera physalus]